MFATCGPTSHQVVQQPRNFSDSTAVASLGGFCESIFVAKPAGADSNKLGHLGGGECSRGRNQANVFRLIGSCSCCTS